MRSSEYVRHSVTRNRQLGGRAPRAPAGQCQGEVLPFMLLFLFMSSMESRLPGRRVTVALLALNDPNFLFC